MKRILKYKIAIDSQNKNKISFNILLYVLTDILKLVFRSAVFGRFGAEYI